MTRYVDNSKADKARRKGLVVIGTTSKRKAKAFVKANVGYEIYGIYADGVTEIGISRECSDRVKEMRRWRFEKEVA